MCDVATDNDVLWWHGAAVQRYILHLVEAARELRWHRKKMGAAGAWGRLGGLQIHPEEQLEKMWGRLA